MRLYLPQISNHKIHKITRIHTHPHFLLELSLSHLKRLKPFPLVFSGIFAYCVLNPCLYWFFLSALIYAVVSFIFKTVLGSKLCCSFHLFVIYLQANSIKQFIILTVFIFSALMYSSPDSIPFFSPFHSKETALKLPYC